MRSQAMRARIRSQISFAWALFAATVMWKGCDAAYLNAVAVLGPSPGVNGVVRFAKGVGCSVVVSGTISGLPPNGLFGMHVHAFGNLTAGCASLGFHWNPTNTVHGAPTSSSSHAGDLGNIASDASGTATFTISNPTMSAQGLPALYGRGLVLHGGTDDLGLGGNAGSLVAGNSGPRAACGIIGISSDSSPVQGDCPSWAQGDSSNGQPTPLVYLPATQNAIATFSSTIIGNLLFTRLSNCSVFVTGTIRGLPPGMLLGMHVHVLGDITGGCGSAGLHWNPTNSTHGSPTAAASHAGDLGNIRTDGAGTAIIAVSNPNLSTSGVAAVFGRAIVIHGGFDDLGLGGNAASLIAGNSGPRIACAVIGISDAASPAQPCRRCRLPSK